MITAVHTLIYAQDPEQARAFFRDVLGWPHVDAHEGWLIFKTGPSELGVHPAQPHGPDGPGTGPGGHEITLMCDDLKATREDLESKGAKFAGPIEEAQFGRLTRMVVPGAGDVMLYQPHHRVAYDLPSS